MFSIRQTLNIPQKKISIWRIFIGWSGVCLISAWSQIHKMRIKGAKILSTNARNYTKMMCRLSYDVGHASVPQEFLDSNFWEQIPDFTTRLIPWSGNKNFPYGVFHEKGAKFWTYKMGSCGWCFEIKLIPLAKVLTIPRPRRKWFVFWKNLILYQVEVFLKFQLGTKLRFFKKQIIFF